ncbi:type II toxin-antitoxin system VapC family toxin [Jannaschia formosa]|uniref:type II toxin-antitoxin system VapC family toxin n=1 Tax=Jannaschia formosa TaxID=2259592 RepID=UPI0014307C87|nr:type II toxin-antitoxin system VapC family toxin [Jannaschia formosa]
MSAAVGLSDPTRGAVVDASVAVKWVVQEEGSDEAARLLDGRPLAAPELILPDCAEILWKKAMRGEITGDEAALAAALLARMEAEIVGHRALLPSALALSLELGQPVRDCAYLALAVDRDLPMVTADRRLVRAVSEHGRYARHVIALAEVAG